MGEKCPVILPTLRLYSAIRDILHATNLRHETNGFTSPLKEGVLRIFLTRTRYTHKNIQESSRILLCIRACEV